MRSGERVWISIRVEGAIALERKGEMGYRRLCRCFSMMKEFGDGNGVVVV